MTVVKICGITNIEDAVNAAEAGADVLGFNFYQLSPRYVEPNTVRAIMREVRGIFPEILAAGVFVNAESSRVQDMVTSSGIDIVQLHGDEDLEYVSRLRQGPALPIIKAFRVGDCFSTSVLDEFDVDAILFDGFSPNEFGGTGTRTDWPIAASVVKTGRRMYLAGGLSADNVAEAIRTVRPYAVDACSLLESSKGRKDPEKVRRFIENVKNYEQF